MKRKTNLFYTQGNDSNFLTFSNFSEHLTGNLLATNYKLFPSRFLCLYLPKLEKDYNENEPENFKYSSYKEQFIVEYLTGYYENKLAFLRDKISLENNEHPDNKLLYLNYLLNAIRLFDSECNFGYDVASDETKVNPLPYFCDIVEQNYNGSFTDIICNIDSVKRDFCKISTNNFNFIGDVDYTLNNEQINGDYLYGWYIKNDNQQDAYISTLPENIIYKNSKPILDDENKYSLSGKFSKIIKLDESETTNFTKVKFNVLIPLYDIVNIDEHTNSTILTKIKEIDIDSPAINDVVTNVPYGIWLPNKTIELEIDQNTGYGTSWSLLIGTQFKSFPNSSLMTANFDGSGDMKGYQTFAQIISKQNEVLNSINKYQEIINDLHNKINYVQNQIANIVDITKINNLIEELTQLKEAIENNANINGGSVISSKQKDNWIYK